MPPRSLRCAPSTCPQPASVARLAIVAPRLRLGTNSRCAALRENRSEAQSEWDWTDASDMLAAVRPPPLPHQLDVLHRVLETVSGWDGARAPAVVFDLDATLFDNRPRTLEILMEYREAIAADDPGLADALLGLETSRIEYLLTDTLKGCGVYRAD